MRGRRTLLGLMGATLFAFTGATSAGQTIGQLADPTQPAAEAYVDILSARIEQQAGQVTFSIETRGAIPATTPNSAETITYLWLVDADDNAGTGQNHGALGSEFNIRVVVDQAGGNGFIDVTGAMPGGGGGLPVTVQGNHIRIRVALGQIGNPACFHWRCDATYAINGQPKSTNSETATIADATPMPYKPLAGIRIVPPLLMLSVNGQTTGRLGVEIRDAAGNLLPVDDYHLTFSSSNPAVATVDDTGLVTARAVPVHHWEVPYIQAAVDGLQSDNSAVARVTSNDLDVVHRTYCGRHVAFYLPESIEGVDLDAITTDYQVVQATDLAYAAQQVGLGTSPFNGGMHFFSLDVTDDPATCPCGGSGNPVRLGWQFGKPRHNSCYIVNAPERRSPQWFILFHEMGHNFNGRSRSFNEFVSGPSQNHNFAYSEAFGSLAALWSYLAIAACRGGLDDSILASIDEQRRANEADYRGRSAAYRNAGADYATLDPSILDGILCELHDRYGDKLWFDLLSTFLPATEPLPCSLNSTAKQAGWFVAACSVSAGQDLRQVFATSYGFPIDDEAWPVIYNHVEPRIQARPWQPCVPADFDCDSDVDGDDFLLFEKCLSGTAMPSKTSLSCRKADFDHDDDVDQADFDIFQRCYGGRGRAGDPACTETGGRPFTGN